MTLKLWVVCAEEGYYSDSTTTPFCYFNTKEEAEEFSEKHYKFYKNWAKNHPRPSQYDYSADDCAYDEKLIALFGTAYRDFALFGTAYRDFHGYSVYEVVSGRDITDEA